MIYFMASGASEKMAYSNAAFLFTEMQWIDARLQHRRVLPRPVRGFHRG
ncbi:MAG: hypothetical protein ACLTYW_08025 [Collinsella sp.]